ncbi:LAMI_0F06898g1_1 [Lachancea mirantina]|uniref:Nucleolar protein 12 n=1 Tax=Lachancea mirantina TaxID=1230905 RepID=A0A1G4JZA6_9SACH|nr:LAMI_0F06898g1_1 [Lachancea mirantina]
MSSVDNLFGPLEEEKLASNVNELFSKSTGPVSTSKLKLQSRTVLPEIEREEQTIDDTEQDNEKGNSENLALEKDNAIPTPEPAKKKRKTKKWRVDANDDLEAQYFTKTLNNDSNSKDAEIAQERGSDDVSKSEITPETETGNSTVVEAAKKVNMKEEELEKANRTVFVGNVPAEVILAKKAYKQFRRLFEEAGLQSSFKKDISRHAVGSEEASDSDSDDDDNELQKPQNAARKTAIQSIRFRSISFEEALPRKVAFVQQKLHKSRDSVNAYVVYKDRTVVQRVCKQLNANVFLDHHLRVDSVAHPAEQDKKRSVFVGNLDFEESEENLWTYFETCGAIEYVRIIRDPKTNLGKGFAYVQFFDFQSINKALLLDGKKLNGTGRKVRISRCKNMKKTGPDSKAHGHKRAFTDSQRTKFGRAKKVLGKADRATIGKEITVEGLRAAKGDSVQGLKSKKQRSKTGRVTKRSTAFRKKASQQKNV